MHWDTYLVRLNPDVSGMDAWQERLYRKDAITEGFIRPQAQEMALELENSRNILHSLNLIYRRGASTNPDQIIKHAQPRIRLMAIQDKHDKRRCEKPIMMWDKLSNLACEALSTHPTKQEIMYLHQRCIEMLRGPIDRDTEGEIWQTVNELDTLLDSWDENTERLLRFYPAGSSKTARFNRYAI